MNSHERQPLLLNIGDENRSSSINTDVPEPNKAGPRRLQSLDFARGFIMILMSWDHLKDSARYTGADGTVPSGVRLLGNASDAWFGPEETYHGSSWYFMARVISHFCAPGFALLMGVGMVLLSEARREKDKWGTRHLLGFFTLRGCVLIALGFVVRAAQLVRFIDPEPRDQAVFGHSGAAMVKNGLLGFFQVMTCLGLQMIVLGGVLALFHGVQHAFPVLRTLRVGPARAYFGFVGFFRFGVQQLAFFVLGMGCLIATQAVIHHEQHGDPAAATPPIATTFVQNLVRFLMVPGKFSSVHSTNYYPVVPWLTFSLWGCAFGNEFRTNPAAAHARCLLYAVACAAAFPLVRGLGGATLNLRGWPLHEHRNLGALAFFLVCKYPPSFAYATFTLAIDFLLIFAASYVKPTWVVARWVLNYGRSPLVFYLSHFWIICLIALLIFVSTHEQGLPLQFYPLIWVVLLALEVPVCCLYGRFKGHKSPDSLWRLL